MIEKQKTGTKFLNSQQEKRDDLSVRNTQTDSSSNASRMAIRPLKTYRGDTEEAIQRQKESIASIALQEQKKRAEEKKIAPSPAITPENQKHIMAIAALVIGIAAIGGGIFALIRYGNFSFTKTKPSDTISVKNTTSTPSLIPPHYEREIDIAISGSKEALMAIVSEETAKERESGSITNIFLTQAGSSALETIRAGRNMLSTEKFLSTFFSNAPDTLRRSLHNNFMLGVYHDTTKKGHAFLIFKTNSFEVSFPGMISWEKTLPQDLGVLIGAKEEAGGFKDVVMRNKDTRSLVDRGREPVLIYSFIDRNTILVASNKETFGSILDVLSQPKHVRQ